MATVYANHAFNILDIDFSRLLANRTGWEFQNNDNLRYRGQVYRDGYQTEWSSGGNDFISLFRGGTLTVSGGGNLTGGTVQSYSEYLWTGSRFYELWGMTGISLAATDVFRAMRSPGLADDDALIERAFRGADGFRLSPDPDLANGFAGNDMLAGGGGGDVLGGGTGNDRLLGQHGHDHLFLDPGRDLLLGGPGRDTVHVSGARDVTIRLGVTGAQDTGYGLDRIRGVENVEAGRGDDRLFGNAGANILTGNRGSDLLAGRGGHDQLAGGGGADRLFGNGGNDLLIGHAGPDQLRGGSGADRLFGNRGHDLLAGHRGPDHLSGGGGADRLLGGLGRDLLTGDGGADRFIFRSVAEIGRGPRSSDVITDFQHGRDLIDLSRIDASRLHAGNNSFTWRDDGAIGTRARGEVQWDHLDRPGHANDFTLIRIDTDADRAAEAVIRLHGLIDLSADDFLF